MSRGEPDIKAIFSASLDVPEGPERDAYLDAACGGDAGLRRRIEELLAAFGRASDVLGPPGPPAAANSDSGLETSERAREAGLEAAGAPTLVTGSEPRFDHGSVTAPGAPGTTAALDDRGSRLNGDALPQGTALRYFGDYEIRRELGRGGMGVVYEARQVSLNRPVALKMVKAGLLAGDDELRRFQNEAEAVALLDHPGVVPVYEVGEYDGQHYFSMKLVPGGSLVPLMNRYKDDPCAAAGLVAEAAEAVAHAHARGILHRDLKPANILVDAEGHPHVTDFGLAKKVVADVELTQSGAILGTPAYMSPEQATGHRGAVTTASDVYGLGAVLYALFTGRAPFGGDSVMETLDAVRNTPPEPPSRLNAALPRDLETICVKCLEKDPRRRYPTALALADDLRAWLDSRPITARRVGAAERAWLWCRRKPAVAALVAAVALAIVGGTVTVIAVQRQANLALAAKNADLTAANQRVKQRYDLAVEAIKTFHTGVSEDFLLQQDQFKEVRDRLLKSASDFYGKLGALLGKDSDLVSRRALWQANYEVAELTDKVGKLEDALAAHRQVLAAREALAAETQADPESKAEVGRSLMAIATVLQTTGANKEAEVTYRKAETLLVELAPTLAEATAQRVVLADCRSRLGWLLHATGRDDEALPVFRLARADQEALAAAPGATPESQRDLAGTISMVATVLGQTGKLPEAVAEYRTVLAILQKLAADNPRVTDFRSRLAGAHNALGVLLTNSHKFPEVEAEFRNAQALYQKLTDDSPGVTEFRSRLADTHIKLGNLLWNRFESAEAEAEAARGWRSPKGWLTTIPPPTNSATPWQGSTLTSAQRSRTRASQRKRRPSSARRWRSYRSWPMTIPSSPNSATAWGLATSNSAGYCRIRASQRKRRPSSARRWRSHRSWSMTTPTSPSSASSSRAATTISAGAF
jgi:tetratricopeptide (TPR) repeat protein